MFNFFFWVSTSLAIYSPFFLIFPVLKRVFCGWSFKNFAALLVVFVVDAVVVVAVHTHVVLDVVVVTAVKHAHIA